MADSAESGLRGGAVALGRLVDLPAVAASFASVHGVGLAILDGAGVPVAEVRHGSEALDHFASSFPKGVSGLQATREALRTVALEGGAGQVRCFTGVRYLVRPLLRGGRPVGRVALGPYVPGDLHGISPALAALDPELASNLGAAQAETLLSRIRRLDERQALDLSAHLATIVSALARPEPLSPGALVTRASLALGPLSHELRTPLTAVIGYSDMLAEGLLGPLSPEQEEAVLTILERSEALLLTLNGLLDLAATASGPVPLLRESTDLTELVVEAVDSLASVARRAGVTVQVKAPEPGLPSVPVDRSRLRESLAQLLCNAIKFNHPSGLVTVEVRRRPGSGPALIEVEVADSGIGVEPAQLERIFDPFYQVDSSPTRSFPGVGLGLALVRAHAEAHGGLVRVESTPGKGSRFTLALPLARPAPGGFE